MSTVSRPDYELIGISSIWQGDENSDAAFTELYPFLSFTASLRQLLQRQRIEGLVCAARPGGTGFWLPLLHACN